MSDDDEYLGEPGVDADEEDVPAAAADGEAEEEEDADDAETADAAGSDEEASEDSEGAAADSDSEAPARRRHVENPAAPARVWVDPLLRAAGQARAVRVVPVAERMTDGRLHSSEAAYVLAMRAEQIAKHGSHFASPGPETDPVALAYRELFERRCPFLLRREVGTGAAGELLVEEWDINLMTLPALTAPAVPGV